VVHASILKDIIILEDFVKRKKNIIVKMIIVRIGRMVPNERIDK
jgi:hypothetical protein